MASYGKYENDYKKYSHSQDMFKKPKSMTRHEDISKEKNDRLIEWTTFYRKNMHRFIEHYFGVKLHPFQKIWIYLISVSEIFMCIGSRGISKSFIVGLYAVAKCTLYPQEIVVIAAGSKKQGGLIISEKIEGIFRKNYPNIAREIRKVVANSNDWEVQFHNGSKIIVVPASDNARGHRATTLILEEFRIIDKKVVDEILSPFLISRQPQYLLDDKYSHLVEEPKQIYISSAYYKSEWIWDEFKKVVGMHYDDDTVNFLGFDYLLAIKHGLKTKKQISKEKEKVDAISFMMEYENIMFGENENSYFKLDLVKKNQILKRAFYPLRRDSVEKKNQYDIKKVKGEIRIISADIATRTGKGSEDNDNTIISCLRLLPTLNGYQREVVYMEAHHGENTILQTLRLKQIYNDFKCDYIVLDIQNAGIAIYSNLGLLTKDEERGIEYPPMTVVDERRFRSDLKKEVVDELKEKTLAKEAIPNIYPISASQKLNSTIAVSMRDNLEREKISFLVEEHVAEDYLMNKNKEYGKTQDLYTKFWFLHPYEQIRDFANEIVNLEYKISNGNVVLSEGRGRKDRYTSVSYANYFASILERDLLKEKKEFDWSAYMVSSKSKLSS